MDSAPRLVMLLAALALGAGCVSAATGERPAYGLGHAADPATIRAQDIDVAPDGTGLPAGRGDAVDGSQLFHAKCLRCHGSFIRIEPERWAYATTLFDYVRRAMPPDRSTPLTADEEYALTAFLLATNADIAPRDIIDEQTLPRVQMPRVKDFISNR